MSDMPLLIAPGSAEITKDAAGSKAAELWRLAHMGLDVPPAFVMPTDLCRRINADDPKALAALRNGLAKGIAWLEDATGRRFGDGREPLLVSVRSGAAISMPGMLETILNVGLNAETVHGLIRLSGNPRLAFDCHRRLIQSFAEVVDGVPAAEFEQRLADMIRREGTAGEIELDPEALERLATEFRQLAEHACGRALPDDPFEQLEAAATAIYKSWECSRAREYRRLNGVSEALGTAVTVQAMVFGNSGGNSGAGVAFSRNPATGANEPYIDFLFDAQGEDVVSGRRVPGEVSRLKARLPETAQTLADGLRRIEHEYRDAQDVEFTIEHARLFFLQTRTAKRAPRAALRIAVDMVHEGLIDTATALHRLEGIDIAHLAVTHFAEPANPVATAVSASLGVASGCIAFDSAKAKEFASGGEPVILVRPDTSTDDVVGFSVANGILTAVGGRTAHAAVVARQLGKVCLVGCSALEIDEDQRRATIAGHVVREGDWLSLDGERGEVTLGKRAIVVEQPPELAEIERWRLEKAS